MLEFGSLTVALCVVMVANGVLTIPFGVMANRAFRDRGRLTTLLALWSGIAMHGHAAMTFAVAWLDRGSLYSPNLIVGALGAFVALSGAYIIYLGRRAYGDQARVYGLLEDELLTGGIYNRSRNPQYFGYGLMFLGAAIASGSTLSFVFTGVFGLMIHAGITLVEEPHLVRVFGSTYRKHKQSVGRYFT